MTINLITKGGGNSGVVDAISIGNQVASSSSGELFNVDPGSTKRVVITALMPDTTAQTLIDIDFDARNVFSGTIADAVNAPTELIISQGARGDTPNEYSGAGSLFDVRGGLGEVLTVTKTSGSTTAVIYLSYKITD